MLGNIRSRRLLYVKAILFVVLGAVAAVMNVLAETRWERALLLAVTVWAFCRAYYFAFYVIEHYVDPRFRFAGLGAFLRYALTGRSRADEQNAGKIDMP
jgi:hypothetical protein